MVEFIDQERDEFDVESICRALPIASSTYYAAKRREATPSARAVRPKSSPVHGMPEQHDDELGRIAEPDRSLAAQPTRYRRGGPPPGEQFGTYASAEVRENVRASSRRASGSAEHRQHRFVVTPW